MTSSDIEGKIFPTLRKNSFLFHLFVLSKENNTFFFLFMAIPQYCCGLEAKATVMLTKARWTCGVRFRK